MVRAWDLRSGGRGFTSSLCTVEYGSGKPFIHMYLFHQAVQFGDAGRHMLGSKQAHHATRWPHVHGLAASTGALLRTIELGDWCCPMDQVLPKDFDFLPVYYQSVMNF